MGYTTMVRWLLGIMERNARASAPPVPLAPVTLPAPAGDAERRAA